MRTGIRPEQYVLAARSPSAGALRSAISSVDSKKIKPLGFLILAKTGMPPIERIGATFG
jgi:hypothetical protein